MNGSWMQSNDRESQEGSAGAAAAAATAEAVVVEEGIQQRELRIGAVSER